jgi:hypothetical protein
VARFHSCCVRRLVSKRKVNDFVVFASTCRFHVPSRPACSTSCIHTHIPNVTTRGQPNLKFSYSSSSMLSLARPRSHYRSTTNMRCTIPPVLPQHSQDLVFKPRPPQTGSNLDFVKASSSSTSPATQAILPSHLLTFASANNNSTRTRFHRDSRSDRRHNGCRSRYTRPILSRKLSRAFRHFQLHRCNRAWQLACTPSRNTDSAASSERQKM